MIGTYAAALAVCVASLAIGQAVITLCGRARWSWSAAPVGLAILCAVCWGTVRLPGHGAISAIVVLVLVALSLIYLQGKGVWREALDGWPVLVVAAFGASLPFIVEGHFGILGTSFNPDMSQHLLAASQLAHGHVGQLQHQGYPLGPHSIVVALNKGLDIGLVKGFSGLSVAVAVLAPLTALAAFRERPALVRTAAALVVGLAYVVASYFAQGAFKETMLALFLLGFVLCLRESWREPIESRWRFVPLALIPVGAVYIYSFPGLLWLLGTAVVWAIVELGLGWFRDSDRVRPVVGELVKPTLIGDRGARRPRRPRDRPDDRLPQVRNLRPQRPRPRQPLRPDLAVRGARDLALRATSASLPVTARSRPPPITSAPPSAPCSSSTASGPAGASARRSSSPASSSPLVAYLAARVGGTAYTSAKAIEIAAPLCALTILLPLTGERGVEPFRLLCGRKVSTAALVVFLAAAGLCSALALANAPVGPSTYTPALASMRPLVENGSTLILASPELLEDDHGTNYLAWELRGGRVCIATRAEVGGKFPTGVRYVIVQGSRHKPPFKGLRLRKASRPTCSGK